MASVLTKPVTEAELVQYPVLAGLLESIVEYDLDANLPNLVQQRELCTIGRVKRNPTLDEQLQNANTASILGVLIDLNKNPVTPAEKCLTYGIHAAAGIYEARVIRHYGKASRTACRQQIFPHYGQPHYKLFSRIGRHREYVEQFGILITTAGFFGNTMIDLPRSIHSRLLDILSACGIPQAWKEAARRPEVVSTAVEAAVQRFTAHLGYID